MYIKSSFIDTYKFEDKFKEFKEIPFSFFFDYIPTLEELNINSINIFAHDEPNEYFGHHDWILQNYNFFSLILTWNNRILRKCPNSTLLLYGEGWVDEEEKSIFKQNDKQFEISFIRGKKLLSTGHLLRHQIFNREDEIIIPTKFLGETDMSTSQKLIEGKIKAHQNSMYSLIIENTNHHNYFTEKITDCILMKSIPVYWGCTNIENFYNSEGIIQIYSDDDAIEKINKLTPEYYLEKKDIIEENWRTAFKYRNYIDRIADILRETFKINNIT
jgi:hypothetical protein